MGEGAGDAQVGDFEGGDWAYSVFGGGMLPFSFRMFRFVCDMGVWG